MNESKFFKIRLPLSLLSRLSEIAKAENKSVSEIIREIIERNI